LNVDNVRVSIRLFGAFRKYGDGSEIALDVPRGTTVAALRAHLGEVLRRGCAGFAEQDLLDVSVLADDEQIREDAQPLGRGVDRVALAVLPPVCGG
jgi:molybdopterin converting factor small subunit